MKNVTKSVTKAEESLLLLSKNIEFVSNVRKSVDTKSDSFKNLKTSINNNGLRSALNVYKDPVDGKYYLIAGHRRLKAIQELENEYNITSEVPVIVSPAPNGDLSTLQLEENLLREDLSFLEEVLAFKEMIKKDSTIKGICEKFGHSHAYVKERLHFSNLSKELLKPYVFNSDKFNKKDMKEFATNTLQIQREALNWAAQHSESKSITAYVKSYFGIDDRIQSFLRYENLVGIKESKDVLIDLCQGLSEFEELQSLYQNKRQDSLQLFKEFTEDYDGTIGFVKFALANHPNKKMNELWNRLLEVKVVTDIRYDWSDNISRASSLCQLMIALFDKPKEMDKIVGRCELKDGQVFVKTRPIKKEGSKETVERTKYYLQTKKFAKATVPSYIDHLYVTYRKGKPTEKQVEFIMKDEYGISLKDISVGSHQYGYNLKRIHKLSNSNPKSLANEIFHSLVREYMFRCTIQKLDRFAKLIDGSMSYKEWCLLCWDTNTTIKENMLLAISTTNLRNAFKQTGSKKDIVKYMTDKMGIKFPFKDIFTSKEADWKGIEVKSAYLDKKLIYSNMDI